jgi:hypothetical protein
VSEPAEVVSIHEQLNLLEGFPIAKGKTRFSLVNDKRQVTDKVFKRDDFVSFSGKGRVKALHLDSVGTEEVATFIVEVLSVKLT